MPDNLPPATMSFYQKILNDAAQGKPVDSNILKKAQEWDAQRKQQQPNQPTTPSKP